MRVLVLTQYFWPETFRINDVAKALSEAGANITVLTGQPNYPEGRVFPGYRAHGVVRERFHDIEILRVPLVPRGGRSAFRLALNYVSFAASASLFGPWLLRGQAFDVVFVYAPSPILQALAGIVAKRLKRCPLVIWIQDLWPESLSATGFVTNQIALKLVEYTVRFIYRRADLLLVQSRAFVEPVARLAGDRSIRYFPNPGDPDLSTPDAAPCPIPGLGDRFDVVFAGNFGTAQALHTLLDAAVLLRDEPMIRFVLVGSGSLGDWLAAEVNRRGLPNVLLSGRYPPDAMPAIFAHASALLVTLAAREVFRHTVPSKIQSYLAAGKPIVAALDGEGARIVAEAGAGVCSAPEDGAALAAAVRELAHLEVPALAAMGARGRAYFEAHFEPRRLTRQLVAVLEDVAARRG